jgi:hypothetical protein
MSTPRKLKACRMWGNYFPRLIRPDIFQTREDALDGSGADVTPRRVAVIPLDDVDRLIVTAAAAHYKAWSGIGKPTNGDCMRAALTAIGVLPRARKGRK